MRTNKALATLLVGTSFALFTACGGDDPIDGNEEEVITTVSLAFTPTAGGDTLTFEFSDDDGDGGNAPTIDDIALTAGDYSLAVSFFNRLEDPPENITEEISDEAADHQIFFTGSAVDGPASDNPGAPLTHAYDDEDVNTLPVGLDNTITAAVGSGDLVVTLRHMPPVNEEVVKFADAAEQVGAGGFAAIGGDNDVQVTLPVDVQ